MIAAQFLAVRDRIIVVVLVLIVVVMLRVMLLLIAVVRLERGHIVHRFHR